MTLRFKFVIPINLILVGILAASLAWEWWRLGRSEFAILCTRLNEESRFVHADLTHTRRGYLARRSAMGDDGTKKIQTRVNRIAGQVTGIQRMVEDGRYYVEVLNQIAAVRSALDSLGIEILTRHLESCVLGHGRGHEHSSAKAMTKEQLLAEMQTVLSRSLK